MHILVLDSAAALRQHAAAWDDLWWRSEVTLPTIRAELIAQWLEFFAPRQTFRAVAVEDGGQFVAALPLVGIRVGRVLSAGGMPQNVWTPSGELLIDPQTDIPAAAEQLVQGLSRMPWPLLWLDNVVYDAPRWTAVLAALAAVHIPYECRLRYRVGLIDIGHDWEAYQATWSAGHRRNMRRYRRKLTEAGPVEFQYFPDLAPEEVALALRRGYELEDQSWKGGVGSSVLRQPGLFEFCLRQAQQLARWEQLGIAFLIHGDRPIAFECGWNAKGVHHAYKQGYDPQFAPFSPGQLLLESLLHELHADPQQRAVNCLGPLTAALAAWRGRTFPIGRLAIAPRGGIGRWALRAYQRFWPATPVADAPAGADQVEQTIACRI